MKYSEMRHKLPLLIDFDGTLCKSHEYKFKGDGIIEGEPVHRAIERLREYEAAGFETVIFSTRCRSIEGQTAIMRWMSYAFMSHSFGLGLPYRLSCTKEDCYCQIDDKSFGYENMPTVKELMEWSPWWWRG